MFWEIFVSLCSNHGKSTTAVILELGLSRSLVTSWKNGTVPNNTTLKKISDYFGVSVDYLLGNEEKEKISSPSSRDEIEEQLLERFRSLTKEQQDAYLKIIGINSTKFDKPL